jgi:hypothetical protein
LRSVDSSSAAEPNQVCLTMSLTAIEAFDHAIGLRVTWRNKTVLDLSPVKQICASL